ncbi:rap guanine nucleotide exchange factor 1b isoform X2 [Clupea harengus]|uniref:CRK SH3-binding GNRP n=1 Tax=Clupea harengus TaxID=7950 RepID=A0A8M1KRP5_CLUHA|nr:rap guanine nucleotide exchange factor 1b isoform X2 [Clupea harengus]
MNGDTRSPTDMSGNIENKQEGPRSHLSSLKLSTLKLMDKFHSPKIKRTPSTKGKPPSPEPPAPAPEKPVNKKVSRLEEQEKDVVSALRYFKAIVDKMAVDAKVLEMLPGSASKVLEAILPLVQGDIRSHNSSALSSCHNRVYQSLANLVRWADDVMLKGIDLSDKETVSTVTTMIKAVLDGVKELVKLTIEKQEQPSPTSLKPPVAKAESVCAPLPERDMTLTKTTPVTTPSEILTDMSEEEAPPKPPLPGPKLAEHSIPILPPKKRQSVPSATLIAVVAPMSRAASGRSLPPGAFKQLQQQDQEAELLQRRLSADSQSYSSDSPCLSSCGIMGKLSQSDEQLSAPERDSGQCSRNTSCETLDGYDPDYDFLHQDLSVLESLPPLPFPVPGGSLSPLPECLSECGSPPPGPPPLPPLRSCPPPTLPQKKRRSVPIISTQGLYLSHQLCLSQSEEWDEPDRPPTPPFPLLTPLSPMPLLNGGVFTSQYSHVHTPGGTYIDSPPPLPEKKSRTIMQYMQFMEDYSEPQPSVFYQTPQSESIYEHRQRRLQEVCGLGESFAGEQTHSLTHTRPPPPALPPKQRQMSESAIDEGGEGEYVNLYSNGNNTPHSAPVSLTDDVLQSPSPRLSSSSSRGTLTKERAMDLEDVDELSLIDHKDIMSLITHKQERDDGPDVRAGSVDILLVHATETDRKDLVVYCEAFLTTYRTFIAPEELIKKLHYRYTRFCHSPDTFKKRVSKNTFFVLVRVVDELCHVELTEDILCQLMELVFQLLCNGELSLARVLRSNILEKVDQKRLQRHILSHPPLSARMVSARPGTLHDFRSHEVADQLTLLDAELFYKIEIPEVLLWAKEQNEEKSPNLTQFTEHFNNMSYWVRSVIIQQERAQDREKLLLKFIKIMKHLRKLNNFNSYLAILSALDSAPIRRLEWQKQTSEGLEEYCTLIDSSSSFRAYRAALADVEPPCIPYLGLILQDLTFVHLGNPDLVEGKVNFSKRWQQFNILDSMRRFQQVHYELKRNDDIISFFNEFTDHLAEEALWELSLKIKPRSKKIREEKTT